MLTILVLQRIKKRKVAKEKFFSIKIFLIEQCFLIYELLVNVESFIQIGIKLKEFYSQNLKYQMLPSQLELLQEFYNFEIDHWPSDEEIYNMIEIIQKGSNRNNKLKKNWTLGETQLLIWIVGKIIISQDIQPVDLVTKFIKIILSRKTIIGIKSQHYQGEMVIYAETKFLRVAFHRRGRQFAELIGHLMQQCQQRWYLILANQIKIFLENGLKLQENSIKFLKMKVSLGVASHAEKDGIIIWIHQQQSITFICNIISRENWSNQEDYTLLESIKKIGKKWSQISKEMKRTRSEINVKNRFNSLLFREKEFIIQQIEQDPYFKKSDPIILYDTLQKVNGELNDDLKHIVEYIGNKIKWRIDNLTKTKQKEIEIEQQVQFKSKKITSLNPENQAQLQKSDSKLRRTSLSHLSANQIGFQLTAGQIESLTDQDINLLSPCFVCFKTNQIYFCPSQIMIEILMNQQMQESFQCKNEFDKAKFELDKFEEAIKNSQQFQINSVALDEIEEEQQSYSSFEQINISKDYFPDSYNNQKINPLNIWGCQQLVFPQYLYFILNQYLIIQAKQLKNFGEKNYKNFTNADHIQFFLIFFRSKQIRLFLCRSCEKFQLELILIINIMPYQVEPKWKYIYGGILITSQLCALIIPLLYWSSRKCRHHPASIILILCLFEMVSTYQLYFQTICLTDVLKFFNLYNIMNYYTFGTFNDINHVNITMCWWNQSIYFICVYAQINYYIVLCVDLIITLKKPFYNSSKRNPIYHATASNYLIIYFFLVFFTVLLFCFEFPSIKSYCTENDPCGKSYIEIERNSMITLQVLFLLSASTSFCFGCRDMRDCNDTKRTYFQNHMRMLGAIISMWFPAVACSIFLRFNENQENYRLIVKIIFIFLLANRNYFKIANHFLQQQPSPQFE